jgi:hypothetical protein
MNNLMWMVEKLMAELDAVVSCEEESVDYFFSSSRSDDMTLSVYEDRLELTIDSDDEIHTITSYKQLIKLLR